MRPGAGSAGIAVGDVVASETGTPLGHSMVTVLSFGRQTFTSEAGVFVVRVVSLLDGIASA